MRAKLAPSLLCAALGLAAPLAQAQSLPELVDGVLRTHPSLRAQQALGDSAKQALESAEWQFYPTPSIGVEQIDGAYTDANYPAYGDKSVTTLRLQQPLWTGGRLTAGLDKAQAGVGVTQATLDATRQDLALRVVQVYADWLGANLKYQAFARSLKVLQTLQEQINRRIAGGTSPRSDLTLLLGRAHQTEADLSTAQAQEQSALGRLSQLLGRPLQPLGLAPYAAAPLALGSSAQDLLLQAQAQSPGVLKLQAQARIALGDIAERRAELKPELYLRVESQYGNFTAPGSPTQNRVFVGLSSHLGAGLSSLSNVGGAQARYDAALADIETTRLSLGEQIQSDYAQAQAGQARLAALMASLESSDTIARAWNRQFIAGRKTWLDVMNAMREQAQLEAQIADAKASQLLLTWRLAIVGRGLDQALVLAEASGAQPVTTAAAEPALPSWDSTEVVPLYAANAADALQLRMQADIDPAHLGVGLGAANAPLNPTKPEGIW